MLLETIVKNITNETILKMMKMIECQLKFMQNLVNDLLDLKMVESKGTLQSSIKKFKPLEVFDFIMDMFS